MAQRRMFSPDIVSSDAFLDMPTSSQALYFQLGMYADDDGFVNPRRIMRMMGVADDDLKILISKRFLLPFENGVVVIKHWRINNLVRKDWYKETQYIEEKNTLQIKENGSYTEFVNENVPNSLTQVRLGKVRLGKVKKERENTKVAFAPPSLQELQEFIQLNQYNVDPEQWLNFYESKGWLVGKTKMKDWKAAVRTWAIRNKDLPVAKTLDPIEQEAKDLFKKMGEQAVFPFAKKYGDNALYTYKHCFPGAF